MTRDDGTSPRGFPRCEDTNMKTALNSPTAIQTYSGVFFDPFDPDPELIRIEDIAHSLSMQCRFGGHLRKRWSVAQHSLLVADLCPAGMKLDGLLHDAAEAYLCDLPRPVKHAVGFERYRELEDLVQSAVADRFGLAWPPHEDAIKRADNTVLVAEARALKYGIDAWEHERAWQMADRLDVDDGELVRAIREASPPTDRYVKDDFILAFYAFGGR